jgi:hypothetical protein
MAVLLTFEYVFHFEGVYLSDSRATKQGLRHTELLTVQDIAEEGKWEVNRPTLKTRPEG